ncbi:alpha/beta hydrolase [Methylobacterium terrae]|uniref:Alpha/beta hydrolase n=1 Tax=Methylobacterium terrae TaxID=2202827 RepID=A0A2U8WVX9_9HYPH|nr:alpha/beta hydrolase [Methylobacterium terrae]AWN49638.1 alpha/beta hydrolase [Methylobacterium terrae]
MQTADDWIDGPHGRLFARSWTPDTRGAGERPSFLLFHESLGCVEVWRDFPERLASATGLPVVAYDRLGFGRSDPHPGILPLDFMQDEAAGAVPALIARLGLGRLIAFGHSVGGAMAVATAARDPDRCAAVITVGAQAFVEERTRTGIIEARRVLRSPDQLARIARYHGDKARWALDAWTETWLDPAFAGWTLDEDLARVRCPLLALHGDRDEYGSRAYPDRIARHAGGRSEVVLIEDCGHVPHRERPDAVLQAVTRFLGRCAVP